MCTSSTLAVRRSFREDRSVTAGFRALLLNGSSGVGKSSTLQALGALLGERGEQYALVDLDHLTLSGPRRPDDPYGLRIALRNLAAVTREFRADGARLLAVGHVLTEPAHVTATRAALGDDTAPVIRLRARREVVEARLRERHAVDAPWELDGFLAGHDALERTLADAALDDVVIDVDDLTPGDVAERVARAAGWMA
jgi:hypothetical protein